LDFVNMFVQYPEPDTTGRPFLPDFSQHRPFIGNLTE
jgi:hypothetical protein